MTRTRVRDHIVVSILFASILFPVCSNAQWNANLTLTAPSPYLSDWSSRRNTATLLVTNSTGLSGNIKILADIELNGDLVAFTKPEKVEIRTIQPGQSQLFFGEAIVPYSAIHFEGNIDQSTQRAGRVPDGIICVRVKVVDALSGALLDDDYKCATIISFLPAYLQLPEDGSVLCRLGEHNIIEMNSGNPRPVFRWTPVVPAPSEPIRYQLKIFEVLPGQNHTTAFRSARPLFERELLGATELIWPVEYFYPEAGKRYVWSVRAVDQQGLPLVSYQDGWATPFYFTVVEECREGNIDMDGDGIPDVTAYGKPFEYRSDISVRITKADPSPLDPDIRHEFAGTARSRSGGPFVFRWFAREHGTSKFKPLSSPSNTAKLILAPHALKPDQVYDLRLTAERNGIFGNADLEMRTGQSSEDEAMLDSLGAVSMAEAVRNGSGQFALVLDDAVAGWIYLKPEGIPTWYYVNESSQKRGDLKFEFGTGMSDEVYDWIENAFDKKYERKNGMIVGYDHNDREISRLNFKGALITEFGMPALDAASKDAAKMTLQIKPEVITFIKPDSTKPKPPPDIQKLWTPANFRLEIAGLDNACKRVNKIEALTFKQKVTENAVGEMRDYEKEPTSVEVPNLVLTLPESSAREFYDWQQKIIIDGDFAEGSEKTGTLEYLTANREKTLFTLTFFHLGVFKVTPETPDPNDSKNAKTELKYDRVEFNYTPEATRVY